MRAALILITLTALSAGGFYGYQALHGPDDAPQFKTAALQRGTIVSTVTATGVVEPLVKVLVGSQVSGIVEAWYADFNQEVKLGEVLAELDQDRIEATIAQREASVAVTKARVQESQARLSEAALELTRIEDAFKRTAASSFEIETAKASRAAAAAAVSAAKAQVAEAEAQLLSARIELDKTIIRSPIDGIVISRDIDKGQTVAASLSAPTLFTIANDLRKMRVNAAVSETDIGNIREGMETEFRVDAYPKRRFRGVVTQVRFAETVIDNVVTYQTLIDVDNADLLLRPGMTATIMFEVDRADDVLMTPNAALRFDPDRKPMRVNNRRPGRGTPIKPRVFTLAGGQLREVEVELGINDGSFTQIVAGKLKEGDQVVVERAMTGRGTSRPRMRRGP